MFFFVYLCNSELQIILFVDNGALLQKKKHFYKIAIIIGFTVFLPINEILYHDLIFNFYKLVC